MHSKNSKKQKNLTSRKREERVCSEPELAQLAHELAQKLGPRDFVLLEGPLGAGKTTFARALLQGLEPDRPPEGSPTFSIAHEYQTRTGPISHMDLYRLKSDQDLEDAGVLAQFWESEGRVLCEWASLFPSLYDEALKRRDHGQTWLVKIDFLDQPEKRKVTLSFY